MAPRSVRGETDLHYIKERDIAEVPIKRAKRHIKDKCRRRYPDIIDRNGRSLPLKHPMQHGVLHAYIAISRHKRHG